MMLADYSSSSESQLILSNNREADLLHTWRERQRPLSSSDCSDGEVFIPRSNFLQCTRCFRTFREECMEDHWEEFHPQVECSFCHQSVDRFILRKHQEHYCPERLRFCPRCYVQIPHSQLENHLKTCTTKEFDLPRAKVSPNKGLSFKGTVFEQHTRIAKSFINIARGHRDEKPPYLLVVKAEKKSNWRTPSVDNLVNVFCPSTYCDSGNRQNSVVEDNQLLKKEISKPLKAALSKHDYKSKQNKNYFTQIVGIQDSLFATEKANPNYQYTRVQPPRRAIHLRKVHQSLGNLVREESCRRTFVKSWLQSYLLKKEKKNERLIKNKELLEDSIIDEAIELEMNKDSVSQISQDKWPYFVEHIQRRRSKWKDLGFDLQDCSSDPQTKNVLNKNFQKLGAVDVQHENEKTTNIFTESGEPNDLPYWKLIEKHLDENKDKNGHGAIRSLSKAKDKEEVFVEGFYRFCESCSQLFHEDHLADHAAACRAQKEMSSKARQSINQIWKSKKETSLQARLNKKGSSPLLNIPRPFVAEGTYSSLALSVAPHMKYHRSGHSKYAFITKKGRS